MCCLGASGKVKEFVLRWISSIHEVVAGPPGWWWVVSGGWCVTQGHHLLSDNAEFSCAAMPPLGIAVPVTALVIAEIGLVGVNST